MLFILVEYNVDAGNLWVPHPLSFGTFLKLAPRAGFSEPRLLAKTPLPHCGLQQRTSKMSAPSIARPDSDSLFAIRNSIRKRRSMLLKTWINAEFGL